jgi:hypothetical protein
VVTDSLQQEGVGLVELDDVLGLGQVVCVEADGVGGRCRRDAGLADAPGARASGPSLGECALEIIAADTDRAVPEPVRVQPAIANPAPDRYSTDTQQRGGL